MNRTPTALLFLLLCIFVCPALGADAPATKPNIVYILADDLGYGDVHCLNPERGKIATPQLDKMAGEGMIFTDAHSSSSVCSPTRYGILTGRYNWRSRLQSGVLDGYVEPLIAAGRLTVPALLKQNGYHTAIIGKWHLGYTIEGQGKKGGGKGKLEGAPMGAVTHDGPLTRGFDEFFGFHHARMMKSVFENDRVTQIIEPVDILPALVKRSTEHIATRSKAGQPFFLYVPLNTPHTPIVPSKQWQGKSGLGEYGATRLPQGTTKGPPRRGRDFQQGYQKSARPPSARLGRELGQTRHRRSTRRLHRAHQKARTSRAVQRNSKPQTQTANAANAAR